MWIEIFELINGDFFEEPSPSSQRVWIEIFTVPLHYNFYGSPSSQRVWIEIKIAKNQLIKK